MPHPRPLPSPSTADESRRQCDSRDCRSYDPRTWPSPGSARPRQERDNSRGTWSNRDERDTASVWPQACAVCGDSNAGGTSKSSTSSAPLAAAPHGWCWLLRCRAGKSGRASKRIRLLMACWTDVDCVCLSDWLAAVSLGYWIPPASWPAVLYAHSLSEILENPRYLHPSTICDLGSGNAEHMCAIGAPRSQFHEWRWQAGNPREFLLIFMNDDGARTGLTVPGYLLLSYLS